jgi:hypothetical protein
VPAGVPGELCVAGAGLAHGYLGDPRRTAAAFVPDPHAGRPGERLYRTGDRVRRDATGQLAVHGRADRQVKLAGQRLELGEVEALLAADPAVERAVVEPRRAPGTAGDVLGLVAYVVPRAGHAWDAHALAERLAGALPHALVPTGWVELAALPLDASGKVDRAALPAPAAPEERAEHVPPATPTERALAALLAGVLGRTDVCCATSFFELGGTSLTLLAVQARLASELGRDVPVIELFSRPTVSELARWLDGAEADRAVADGVDEGADASGSRRAAARRSRAAGRARRRGAAAGGEEEDA